MSACRSCGASIIWAETRSAQIPLDEIEVATPAPGIVAFNPATGGARVLTANDLPAVELWQNDGVTLHRAHFATCPSVHEHRVHPAQEALL